MRFYLEVGRAAFRRQLIYRWANLAGLLTNIFFGSIFSYVIIALYKSRPLVAGFDLPATLRYTWLVQASLMVVLQFANFDLMLTIRSGEVVTDLSKPCDFFWYWFSKESGRSLYYLLYRGLPIYAAGALIFQISFPDNWQQWFAFVLSFLLSTGVGIVYRFLYNILAFWITESRASGLLAINTALFFSGSYVPIVFFPRPIYAIIAWLPFNSLLNTSAEIFVGKHSGAAIFFELSRQAFWLFLLIIIGRSLARAALKKVNIQGG